MDGQKMSWIPITQMISTFITSNWSSSANLEALWWWNAKCQKFILLCKSSYKDYSIKLIKQGNKYTSIMMKLEIKAQWI